MANSHRRSNCIDKLRAGDAIEDTDSIKTEILKFYENLNIEHENWRPSPDFEGLASISEEQKTIPEMAFTED